MLSVRTIAAEPRFPLSESEARGEYPRRFLYAGRYVREKRIDVLVGAYRRYRSLVRDPWELTGCGMGPDARLLAGVAGLAEALAWLHDRGPDPEWIGERDMPLAAPYAKEVLADRILAICGRGRAGPL